jgi:hypothetical protein
LRRINKYQFYSLWLGQYRLHPTIYYTGANMLINTLTTWFFTRIITKQPQKSICFITMKFHGNFSNNYMYSATNSDEHIFVSFNQIYIHLDEINNSFIQITITCLHKLLTDIGFIHSIHKS